MYSNRFVCYPYCKIHPHRFFLGSLILPLATLTLASTPIYDPTNFYKVMGDPQDFVNSVALHFGNFINSYYIQLAAVGIGAHIVWGSRK